MATLIVTEYANWVTTPNSDHDIAMLPENTTQRLTLSASATNTAIFNSATKLIRIVLDSGACNILLGQSGTVAAVTGSTGLRFAQTIPEYFGIPYGQTATVISAISTT